MGTSLNGLKPKNTYQALLKTTDNTAIDATLKTISDGLGTDTPLQLSTTETQINSTLRIHTDNAELLDIENASGSNRFNINRVVQNINLDFASKPTDITTQVGAIRTAIDGVNLADVIKFQENGQVTLTERVKIESDSTVTTQTSSVIQSSTANANLVIAPNGTGALIAQIPDGTAVGGNARANYALDLQRVRAASDQIVNNFMVYGTILNGQNNKVNSPYGSILGGNGNSITFAGAGYSTIINGLNCTANGDYSICAGAETTASSGSVAIGFRNNITGQRSFGLGRDNTVSGEHSSALGLENQNTNGFTFSYGKRATAYLLAQSTHGSANGFTAPFFGLAQSSEVIAIRESFLTTGATMVLSLDGTGVTNLIIPSGNNRAWNVQVNWVVMVTSITGTATGITVGDVVTSIDLLAFKRIGGISSASAHTSTATKLMVTTPAAYAACAINYTAGASQEMALTFTAPTFVGGGSVGMRVVATVQLTEVAY